MAAQKKRIEDVISLGKFFPEMAKREQALKETVITEDGVVIGKKCLMHVLAAFREADEETAFDFAMMTWATKPGDVPNIRYPISSKGKQFLLERIFADDRYRQ